MKQYFEIVDVTAREVVGLKFEPTVEVEITLDDETVGRASVPSGMKNAREVSIAVDNVNMEISEAILAMNALDQPSIDRLLLEIDGTDNASRLGANALMAVSLACAKAAAESSGLSLYNYIGGVNAKMIPDMTDAGEALCLSDFPTLTQFLNAAATEKKDRKKLVISAGDGEAEDSVLADLGVALNAEGIVSSSPAVYNELMRIEEELFDVPEYPEQ
jgi:enolase